MSSPTSAQPRPSRASTGVDRAWTTSCAAACRPTACTCSRACPEPARRPSRCSFLLAGAARGERGLYITLSETAEELAGRRLARLVARRHRGLRAARRAGRDADAEQSILYPVGGRARRDRAQDHRADRARCADARRLRLPVGDAPPGAGPAALPPPGARAQAVLRPPALHRAAARRPDSAPGDLQLHSICAWRDQPGADGAGIRRREPAAAGRQDARPKFQGGKHDFILDTGRRGGVSAPGRVASTARRCPRGCQHRQRGARPDARRRPGARHQHAAHRPVRRRQVDAGDPLHARGARARRAGDGLPLRRRPVDPGAAQPAARHGPAAVPRLRAAASSCRSIRPSSRPASSPRACSTRSSGHGAAFVALDSLNGYLQAMPGQSYLLLHLHELLTYLSHRGVRPC